MLPGNLVMGRVVGHPDTGGCWIDGLLSSSLHDHHIIPRNAGGLNGPRCLLCNSCHESIHDAAKKQHTATDYLYENDSKAPDSWSSSVARGRADYLISTIIRTEALAAESANKTKATSLKLTPLADAKIKAYMRRHGIRNKQQAILSVLEAL